MAHQFAREMKHTKERVNHWNRIHRSWLCYLMFMLTLETLIRRLIPDFFNVIYMYNGRTAITYESREIFQNVTVAICTR